MSMERAQAVIVDEILDGSSKQARLSEIIGEGELGRLMSKLLDASPQRLSEVRADVRSELQRYVEQYVSAHMREEVSLAAEDMVPA